MNFLKSFITRWDRIPGQIGGFRLLCSQPECSLSCANLRNGKLSVTSIHGTERHSYELTKNDTLFLTMMFINSLNESELDVFVKVFNKLSPTKVVSFETIGKE